MSQPNEMRRTARRRVSITLKVIGALFIVLVIIRTDWLVAIFQPHRPPHHGGDDIVNNLNSHDTERKSLLRQIMNMGQKPECPIPHLKNNSNFEDANPALCKRIRPLLSSCQIADELFGDPTKLDILKACKTSGDKTYCKIEGSPGRWKASCDVASCDKTLHLQHMDVKTGKWMWKAYSSVIEFQNHIEYLISNENLGFCMVTCGNDDESPPQILNLPPYNTDSSAARKKFININIVFIDSVSRHHFYRSLPRSVSVLNSLVSSDDTLVFDFEKLQGVRSRTFETLQTMFAGDINPFEIPFGTQEMPTKKLGVSEFFKPLKRLGYSTLWLEDLCPYWEWGLSKDLLVFNHSLGRTELHQKFMGAIKAAGIDSIGNTFSSCHILHSNERPDPFHGLDKVCYNGQHQHEYLLDYLKMYGEEKQYKSQPYVSFFETNVGHEGSGKRIQYFDFALRDYLEHISTMHNTFTVILSDHGNAYGDFVKTGNEGRLEMFHPFLFMIIPEGVQKFFSADQVRSLRKNQHRLISVLDLHYTLFYLIEKMHHINKSTSTSGKIYTRKISDFNRQFNVSEYGLLADINPARTCSQIPRVMPNLCICDGYDSDASGSLHYHEILALYFIGTLNNEILKQKLADTDQTGREAPSNGGFGHCKRFTMDKIKNIQQSQLDNNEMVAKMDLYVRTPGQQSAEIFFISVHIRPGSEISLGSFERITPYSQYSVCADKGVEAKLCVCDINSASETNNENDENDEDVVNDYEDVDEDVLLCSQSYSSMESEIQEFSVKGSKCAFIISHANKYGIVYEAVNNCDTLVKLTVTLKPVHLLLSTKPTIQVVLLPKDIKFLTAGVEDGRGDWTCAIHVHHIH